MLYENLNRIMESTFQNPVSVSVGRTCTFTGEGETAGAGVVRATRRHVTAPSLEASRSLLLLRVESTNQPRVQTWTPRTRRFGLTYRGCVSPAPFVTVGQIRVPIGRCGWRTRLGSWSRALPCWRSTVFLFMMMIVVFLFVRY